MPITAERLEVDVQANTRDAQRDLDQFSRKSATAGGAAGAAGTQAARGSKGFGMMGALAKSAGAAMVTALAGKTVMAASDLNEQVSKTGVVFGPQAKKVTDAAQAMADKFGMSKTVFLEAASGIGLVGKASGMSKGAAAGLSTNMAKLAADASSFYNVPVTEALDAMKSGLVGEAEPLRRYGVLLSAAAVETEAARLGISKMGDTLTEGQKVQARASLITKGMADANGDLARTQDSVANRVKEIQGRMANFAADMGTKALPAAEKFLGALIKAPGVIKGIYTSIKEWVSENQTLVTVLGMIVTGIAAFMAVGKMVAMVKAATIAFKAWRAATIAANMALFANPVVLVVAAIAALVAIAFVAYQRFEGFRKIVDAVGAALKGGFVAALDWVKAKWAAWGPSIMATLTSVKNGILGFIQAITPAFKIGFQTMVTVAKIVWDTIKGVIKGAISVVKGVINVVMGVIKGDWGRAWKGIQQIVSGVWGIIKSLVQGGINYVKAVVSGGIGIVKSLWSAGWNAVKGTLSRAWDGIVNSVKSGVGKVVTWVKGLPGKITGALGDLGSLLSNAGTAVIEGFWNGLKGKWEDVKAWFGSITASIPNLKGPKAKDKRLLIENGIAVMQGFKEGLSSGWQDAKGYLKAVTKWIGDAAFPKKVTKDLQARVERVGKRTRRLMEREAKITEALAAKIQEHADKVAAKAQFKDQVASGINSQANLLNSGNSAGAIGKSLEAQVAKAQEFAANLARMTALGFSNDAIAQVAAAGVEGGAETAAALAKATASEVSGINASFSAIQGIATQTSTTLANQLHDAGIGAAQAVVDGLNDKKDLIAQALSSVADGLKAAIKAAVEEATGFVASAKGLAAFDKAQKGKAAEGMAQEASQDAPGGSEKGPKGKGGGKGRGKGGKPTDRTGGGGGKGRNVSLSFVSHNPTAEPQSRTTNKALNRAASLGLL